VLGNRGEKEPGKREVFQHRETVRAHEWRRTAL
jgi:hypothetical protein